MTRIEGCCALIAVKQRIACKSRLWAALPPAAHLALVRSLLGGVLHAARAATHVRQVIVLTPERDTLPADVPVLADTGAGLNPALADAQRALLGLGVSELVVLPADLPGITAAEIDQLVLAGRSGGHSLRRHLLESQRLGLRAQQVLLPGLAFDVDRPADLERLEGIGEAACLPA